MRPEDHREAIAALHGNLGYRLLLSDIEETFEDILSSLAGATDDEQTLRYARLFQVFYRMRTLLVTTPEKFRDEVGDDLTKIKAFTPMPVDPLAPPFPPHRQALLSQIEDSIGL